ncbi:hypothetical protein MHK_001576 [Candidatus Magnetomorum sp. HK-1]|nr:hypothetical protein MHK_001575 [Candidatus Magnetomorum sp. HK-1]KPA18210.1 hypothetical protein MHK_001576 [Candidatus Magnetomorum sp. HK-1]
MIGLLYSAVRNVDVHNFQRFHEEQLEAVERIITWSNDVQRRLK